jgi:CP family cyanate transporter-like MFS transporter
MTKSNVQQKSKNGLLLAGILLIAINLRPALASVGPLIEDIRQATGLSNTMLGLLTTLPLLCFAVVSTLTPFFTKRFGIGGTLLGALVLLVIGIFIRSLDWVPALYLGTLFLGVAIAFGNVLLPGLTKRNFAKKSGFITSLYSSTMAVGASLAAGLSVPLASELKLGWQGSLRFWMFLALIAVVMWLPQLWRLKKSNPKRSYLEALKSMGKSTLAWKVALFMGLQSFTFYVILAWLPDILISRGYDAVFAGWMLSLSQVTGVLGSLLIPFLAGKRKDQRTIVTSLIIIEIIALLGFIFSAWGAVEFWIGLIGFVLGGTFGLALLFIVLRSKDAEGATELSGMAQSIGYLIAAVGPFIFGSLFDLTGNWELSLSLLIVCGVLKLFMGLGAGKPGHV